MNIDINDVCAIAVRAGKVILEVYNDSSQQSAFVTKQDSSPLTLADEKSHQVISKGLESTYPGIPIMSEEGKDISYEERKHWDYYWCVDPLDGTKEFLKRNGEFTVNIALIYKNTPVAGVINVPVTGDTYLGSEQGSFKISTDGFKTILKVAEKKTEWVAVGSRSHQSPEEAKFLSGFPVTKIIGTGSSLKFCLVAEGQAQIYYRHGPTMEWDTAAGHAIANYSGALTTLADGSPFLYNKPSLLNSSFVCRIKNDL